MIMLSGELTVEQWQAARPQWRYVPVLWFYYRMVEVAVLDAHSTRDGKPTDEALLARDWIARSESIEAGAPHEFVSFPECCRMLGLDPDTERVALLELIDRKLEFDEDESWARLETASAAELEDDAEPLFEAYRVVPALDQMTMFG